MIEKHLDEIPECPEIEVRKLPKPVPLMHNGKQVTFRGVPIFYDTEIVKAEDAEG